ncbi:hypothetical protein U1Q18_008407 [Sarracenia purpurea var. burkii]
MGGFRKKGKKKKDIFGSTLKKNICNSRWRDIGRDGGIERILRFLGEEELQRISTILRSSTITGKVGRARFKLSFDDSVEIWTQGSGVFVGAGVRCCGEQLMDSSDEGIFGGTGDVPMEMSWWRWCVGDFR